MFQNMRPGRTKFSRCSSPWGRTTRLPEAATPEGPLAAINSLPTMEAFTDLSYLKTFYKQGHKASRRGTSRTSTEHSSDEEADDRGHKSSSSSRRETPTKIPVPHVPTPTRRCKKRRDEITDSEKDERWNRLQVERDRGRNERFCTRPCGTLTKSSTWLFIRRGSAS